jgi:hypothetical protein
MNELNHPFLFQQIARQIIMHYEPDLPETVKYDSLLLAVARYDSHACTLLKHLKKAEETQHFIKHDMELRIKVPEIWEMQLQSTGAEIESFATQITDHLTKAGIPIRYKID